LTATTKVVTPQVGSSSGSFTIQSANTTALTATAAQDLFTGTTDTTGVGGQTDVLRVIGTSGTKSSIAQFRYEVNQGPNLRHYSSGGSTIGSFTAVPNGGILSGIQSYGSDGTAWKAASAITVRVDGAVSASIIPSEYRIELGDSAGNLFTQARFRANGDFQFNSGYGSAATAYGCRAWVNFNGTGTVAIRASGNVSSITDNGVGLYTVNLTTAMPDINYCATANASVDAVGRAVKVTVFSTNTAISAPTTSAFAINTTSDSNVSYDSAYVNVEIHR
jgi:hypothetical protein